MAHGAGDVLTRLHATFEQHCEGAAAALRGTIDLGTPPPPPPPPLEVAATIDPTATINRKTSATTFGGTVTCSAAARATIAGTITQGSRKAVVTVPFSIAADCSPVATPWRATVNGSLVAGAAKVDLTATAPDPNSGASATSAASRTIELKRQ